MKNNKKGFTIVELVIVIAVIAILAAVLIPTFSGIIDKANISSAEQEARNAYTQYVADAAAEGSYVEKMCIKTSKGYFVYLNNGSVVTGSTTKDAETIAEQEEKNDKGEGTGLMISNLTSNDKTVAYYRYDITDGKLTAVKKG